MAICFVRCENVSRGKGSAAVASAAYLTDQKLRDHTSGQTMHYRHREQNVIATGGTVPTGAPAEWASDPETLWNCVERNETERDARLAKKFVFALPNELSTEANETLTKQAAQMFADRGYACTWAIHENRDGTNPHAHVMVADRPIKRNGQWGQKWKTGYALDADGDRIPLIDPTTGQQKIGARNAKRWKREQQQHWLDAPATLDEIKQWWADRCNELLPQHCQIHPGPDGEIAYEHEGYAARRYDHLPGQTSDICERNRQIRAERERTSPTIIIAPSNTDLRAEWEAAQRRVIDNIEMGSSVQIATAANMYSTLSPSNILAIAGSEREWPIIERVMSLTERIYTPVTEADQSPIEIPANVSVKALLMRWHTETARSGQEPDTETEYLLEHILTIACNGPKIPILVPTDTMELLRTINNAISAVHIITSPEWEHQNQRRHEHHQSWER